MEFLHHFTTLWTKNMQEAFLRGGNYTNLCGSTLLFCQSYQSFKLATLGGGNYTNHCESTVLFCQTCQSLKLPTCAKDQSYRSFKLATLGGTNHTNYSHLRHLLRAITPIICGSLVAGLEKTNH